MSERLNMTEEKVKQHPIVGMWQVTSEDGKPLKTLWCRYTFKPNSRFSMQRQSESGGIQMTEGYYKLDSKQITLIVGKQKEKIPLTYQLDGNRLTIEESRHKLTLYKLVE